MALAYKQAQRKNGEEEVRVKGGRAGSSLELGTGEMYSPLLNRVGLVEHSDEARTWRWNPFHLVSLILQSTLSFYYAYFLSFQYTKKSRLFTSDDHVF